MILAVSLPVVAPRPAIAAQDQSVVTLTPSQEKGFADTYYNCDHEGELGCLEAACRRGKPGGEGAAEIQYLYRDVQKDFPESITAKLRACFVRAGGRFR